MVSYMKPWVYFWKFCTHLQWSYCIVVCWAFLIELEYLNAYLNLKTLPVMFWSSNARNFGVSKWIKMFWVVRLGEAWVTHVFAKWLNDSMIEWVTPFLREIIIKWPNLAKLGKSWVSEVMDSMSLVLVPLVHAWGMQGQIKKNG